jgi:hypothetical protein
MLAVLAKIPLYWHLPFMLTVISLVYSATRHDDFKTILVEAFRWGIRMAAFMFGIGAVLFVAGKLI